MKKFQTSLIALSLLAAAGVSHAGACDASAGNLVANCGFETGDFSGWTLSGADVTQGLEGNTYGVELGNAGVYFDPNPNSGSYQAYFGDLVSNATTLSQSLSTVATATYLISFYLAQDGTPDSSAEGSNQVVATFGTQSLTLKQVPIEGYTLESFTFKATGQTTNLSLSLAGGANGYFLLDDISVTNVPEPASWALVGIALVGVGGLSRKRKA